MPGRNVIQREQYSYAARCRLGSQVRAITVLLIGELDGEVQYPRDLNGNEAGVLDMAFLPDGKSLASTDWDGTLRLWPLSAAAAGCRPR